MFNNTNDVPVSFPLTFYNQGGQWTVPMAGYGNVSALNISLPALGTLKLEFDYSSAATSVGFATVNVPCQGLIRGSTARGLELTPFCETTTPHGHPDVNIVVMNDSILKRFETPDEVREFEKGKFELLHIGGMTIGRATYEPGWKWSVHVGPLVGKKLCDVEHVGMVLSGRAVAAMNDRRVVEMKAGDVFYIGPGHDSWVVGDEPYVSIHLMGAGDYAHSKGTGEVIGR